MILFTPENAMIAFVSIWHPSQVVAVIVPANHYTHPKAVRSMPVFWISLSFIELPQRILTDILDLVNPTCLTDFCGFMTHKPCLTSLHKSHFACSHSVDSSEEKDIQISIREITESSSTVLTEHLQILKVRKVPAGPPSSCHERGS